MEIYKNKTLDKRSSPKRSKRICRETSKEVTMALAPKSSKAGSPYMRTYDKKSIIVSKLTCSVALKSVDVSQE